MLKTFAHRRSILRYLLAASAILAVVIAGNCKAMAGGTPDSAILSERFARHQEHQVVKAVPSLLRLSTVDLTRGSSTALDWPVFSDMYPSRMTQRSPLCLRGNGNGAVVVFLDERNGPYGLWGARLNANGYPADNNVLIYPGSGPQGLGIPAAVSSSKTSLLAFPDVERAGIFILPLDSDLTPRAEAGRITPTANGMLFDRPDIAITSTGVVAVWEDYRFGSRIYARFADSLGVPRQPEFLVHEDLTAAMRWVPRVAAGDGDTTLIAWEDYRAGLPDIYYRIFAGDGTPVTGESLAATGGEGTSQFQPDVIYDAEYGFLLCWIDTRSGTSAIYGRLISCDGSADAVEFLLADPADTATFFAPALAGNGVGRAVVVYESLATSAVITGQQLLHGVPVGDAFTISLPSAYHDRFEPAATYRADGGMLAAWTDYREGDADVRARSLAADAGFAGDDRQVNDDGIGNQQYAGAAVRSGLTSVFAAYTDLSLDEGDIYVREVSAGGQLFGNPVKINDDAGPAYQAEPAMDIDGSKNLYLVWTDARGDALGPVWDIFFQMVPAGLSATTPNVRVSDDNNRSLQAQPDIAVFPAGGAIVVWTDSRLADRPAVFAQLIDEEHELDGSNFWVSVDPFVPDETPPKVAMCDAAQAVVAWRSIADGAGDICLFRYDRIAGLLAYPVTVPRDSPAYEPQEFDLASLPTEGLVVFWRGEDGDSSAVYYQMYDKTCLPTGSNVRVSTSAPPIAGRVSVDVDDAGYMVFGWNGEVGGRPCVMRRIYDAHGTPSGSPEPASNDAGNSISYAPVAVATGRYGAMLFNDNRGTGKGFDVRAGFSLYTATGIVEEGEPDAVPAQFGLAQNYPNPFNSSTMIEYEVSTAGEYELAVYDILGRKVRILADGYFPVGQGSAMWNGVDQRGTAVSSGMYFSRLRGAGCQAARKMILMK